MILIKIILINLSADMQPAQKTVINTMAQQQPVKKGQPNFAGKELANIGLTE